MNNRQIGLCVGGVIGLFGLIVFAMWALPQYTVYHQRLAGEAKLKEAESSRQIAVQEAKAKDEAATLLAEAEVKRAEGVAKANKIIGDSLKENHNYLIYLWIQELANAGHVIYVPTESNLPILEAGRLGDIQHKKDKAEKEKEKKD